MTTRVRRRRSGISLIEVMIAGLIIGILTGIAAPTVVGAKRNATALQALAELRLVDIAINASCSRGVCGPFNPPGSFFGGAVTAVPDAIKEYLPSGYKFSNDTSVYALEMESFVFMGAGGLAGGGLPMCVSGCGSGLAVATSSEDTGFTNTAGFSAPPTIYVMVTVITKHEDIAQRLYDKAGGSAPIYLPTQDVWRYTFPVLVGVPAVD